MSALPGLQARGIRLWTAGGLLHYKADARKLTPELLAYLKAHKAELLAELHTEDATEYASERAAICAADGLPVTMLRPVYTCTLRENRPFTVLGRVGETLDQARADLHRQFGDQFINLEPYRAKSAAPTAPRATISDEAPPGHGGAS